MRLALDTDCAQRLIQTITSAITATISATTAASTAAWRRDERAGANVVLADIGAALASRDLSSCSGLLGVTGLADGTGGDP
jgi:hypothetical protein